MTREEAIKILKFQAGYFCDFKACQEQQAFTMAIKALEQESILDKIRAEIERERSFQRAIDEYDVATGLRKALEILDKYKAESEDKE